MDLHNKEDFSKHSFKNSENPEGMNIYQKAQYFGEYKKAWAKFGHFNYRQVCLSGALPEVTLNLPGNPNKTFVSVVSNDYLGLSQHPAVKAAAIAAIDRYGVGATASPAIGGQMDFHEAVEQKIAGFYRQQAAILFPSGYSANVSTMQALFKKEDLALADAGIHASMIEGIKYTTNVKTFKHNNMEHLETMLKITKGKYRSVVVVVDGVYSQPGDIAPLRDIISLCKKYGAFLAVDDAHGMGVIGQTGRGVIELFDAWDEVDIITGTFSKTLGHQGGFVVARPEIVAYLQFQAAHHIFSVAPPPTIACVLESIALIDSEPQHKCRLWENIKYVNDGLMGLGFNTGNTASAIIPVITGDAGLNAEMCRLLLEAGIYTNQIAYPAVSMKDARIRMAITASHTEQHLDRILNAFEDVQVKMKIWNFE